MKFASAAVKALFLMGSTAESRSIFDSHFLTKDGGKMFTIDVKQGSKSKFGGLLPSDIRKEVFEHQLKEYGHKSVDDLRLKIENDRNKAHFKSTTQLISDDPELISKDLDDWHDV